MKKTNHLVTTAVICLATIFGMAAVTQATSYSVFENAGYFGNLCQMNNTTKVSVPWSTKQRTMVGAFGVNGCYPTSLTNSLVYLEKAYPAIYGTKLTNYATTSDLVYTALTLGDRSSGAPNWIQWGITSGTTAWYCYVPGTYNYIENQDPSVTAYFGQASNSLGSPDWVSRGYPTWDFLYNHLEESQAVMIYWWSSLRGGHYMSLIGMTWDDVTNTGTIKYMDPKDGQIHGGVPIWLSNGSLMIDYGEIANGYPLNYWWHGTAKIILADAFGPSPIKHFSYASAAPLPSTLLLLGSWLVGLGAWRRKRALEK